MLLHLVTTRKVEWG